MPIDRPCHGLDHPGSHVASATWHRGRGLPRHSRRRALSPDPRVSSAATWCPRRPGSWPVFSNGFGRHRAHRDRRPIGRCGGPLVGDQGNPRHRKRDRTGTAAHGAHGSLTLPCWARQIVIDRPGGYGDPRCPSYWPLGFRRFTLDQRRLGGEARSAGRQWLFPHWIDVKGSPAWRPEANTRGRRANCVGIHYGWRGTGSRIRHGTSWRRSCVVMRLHSADGSYHVIALFDAPAGALGCQ